MRLRRSIWPFAIITAFVLFIFATACLIVIACSHKSELVSAAYYEEELAFQKHIDQVRNAQAANESADIRYEASANRIVISLPGAPLEIAGTIHLYRPSAAKLDQKLALHLDAHGVQLIDCGRLQAGLWRVGVAWTSSGQEYFTERRLVLGDTKTLAKTTETPAHKSNMEYLTALILGLVGSLHCAGMCGPLALALPHPGTGAKGFVASRIAYNLGRIITYSVLGIVFGAIGQTLVIAGLQRWTSIGLGLILIMAILFSRRLGLLNFVTNVVYSLKTRMSSLMQRRSFSTLAMLGLFNGLLPCGLVYVAATASVATGSSFRAAWFMFVFGLGTFPMMLTLSLSTKLLPPGFRIKYRRAIPVTALLLASLLIVRGMNLGIPYLSPNLERPAACCKSH